MTTRVLVIDDSRTVLTALHPSGHRPRVRTRQADAAQRERLPMSDRGTLINAEASAGAHLVDAREALRRVPPGRQHAAQRASLVERLRHAEEEHARAAEALKAAPEPGAPIALRAEDTGEIMAYACGLCRNVMSQGHAMGGYEPNDPRRHPGKEDAAACCRCSCGKPADVTTWNHQCAERREKDRPAREAEAARRKAEDEREESEADAFASRLTTILERWDPERMWPLTITTGRDGLDFVAFPLELDEVPRDVCQRVDAAHWLFANSGAPFGRGRTLEAAVNDLLDRAEEIRAKRGSEIKAVVGGPAGGLIVGCMDDASPQSALADLPGLVTDFHLRRPGVAAVADLARPTNSAAHADVAEDLALLRAARLVCERAGDIGLARVEDDLLRARVEDLRNAVADAEGR